MLRTLKDFEKCTIGATDGDIGHTKDLYFDDHTWVVRYLVVDTGSWLSGRKVLIAPQWIGGVQWSDESVTVDLSREAVKAAPPYDPSADLDRLRETGLYTHYGRPPYWKADSTSEHEV